MVWKKPDKPTGRKNSEAAMKKIGDLMNELGFRPDASDTVKKAFVENLVRTLSPEAQALVRVKAQKPSASLPEQLSFFETEALPTGRNKPKAG